MPNKKLANVMVGLLVLQFALGILANLYSTIPAQKSYEVFHQFGFILFHVLNAILLLVLAIVLLVKSRHTPGLKQAIGGLSSIVWAFVFGELFVFTQLDFYSFLMALGFIGALLSYARVAFADPAVKS